MLTLLKRGAEADVYLSKGSKVSDNTYKHNISIKKYDIDIVIEHSDEFLIVKHRPRKIYRHKDLDTKIRKKRTKTEIKILEKLSNSINVPRIVDYSLEDMYIIFEYINGITIRDYLDSTKDPDVLINLGSIVGKMHSLGVIHGDLTTVNFILKNNKIFVIDFGLSFFSNKVEDKATDLHLLKEVLQSRHWYIDNNFDYILSGYKQENPLEYDLIINRLKDIELRGRYKRVL